MSRSKAIVLAAMAVAVATEIAKNERQVIVIDDELPTPPPMLKRSCQPVADVRRSQRDWEQRERKKPRKKRRGR